MKKQKHYLLISDHNWKILKKEPERIDELNVDYIITTKYCSNNQSYVGVADDSGYIARANVVWKREDEEVV